MSARKVATIAALGLVAFVVAGVVVLTVIAPDSCWALVGVSSPFCD